MDVKTLALQGGGCLGKGQAVALVELERRAGKPLCQIFGFVGGTSVGSIIGAPVACGIPMTQVNQFFDQDAPVIFSGTFLNTIEEAWEPKYSAAPLEAALQKMLGNLTLADCKIPFIATSYDFATDRLVFFKSYELSSSNNNFIVIGPDSGIKLWQVLRASSAAQSYFPAFQLNIPMLQPNDLILMDGGNTGDNAPDLLVFTEAQKFLGSQQNEMLSVGSGNSKWNVNADSMVSPSVFRGGLETIKITFSAGESNAVILTGKNLRSNYYRLVADLGNGYELDDASIATFAAITAAWQMTIQANSALYNKFSS
jgi:patatin-like phospholipase/acyl hydrolase